MKIIEVVDIGNDVLQVKGRTSDDEIVTAYGWVSAMTDTYKPNDYFTEDTVIEEKVEDATQFTPEDMPENAYEGGVRYHYYVKGDIKPDAKPHDMSKKEKESYWLSLLEQAQPERKVLFEAKE